MASIKQQFIHCLEHHIPRLRQENLDTVISDNMISSYILELPKEIESEIREFIKAHFKITHSENYQKRVNPIYETNNLPKRSNLGLMMSYDFHWNSEDGLKLIEVNTNASFLFLGSYLNLCLAKDKDVDRTNNQHLKDLQQDIESELELNKKEALRNGIDQVKERVESIAIVDIDPPNQRLFSEFLVAQATFEDLGYRCEIKDSQSDLQGFDLIYNRDTDFFLQSPQSEGLKKIYTDNSAILSPHPYEYFLSADKSNNLSLQEVFSSSILLKSEVITEQNFETIWSLRKKFFIKPANSFGSKTSYKGASISRKAFDEARTTQKMIAQEFCAPTESITPDQSQKFKWDLRCYAYGDKYKFSLARLYQGQVTNARTEGGGFATVRFNQDLKSARLVVASEM